MTSGSDKRSDDSTMREGSWLERIGFDKRHAYSEAAAFKFTIGARVRREFSFDF